MSRLRLSDTSDCNVLSDRCRLLPNVHALRTLDNWYGSSSSARRFLRSSKDRLFLAFAFAFDLSLAFTLALAIESLPRDHSYRVQLQSFCQRVVRLRVFAQVTQQSGEIRLMDFVVFRLILLTIVVVRYAFPPCKRLCQSIP